MEKENIILFSVLKGNDIKTETRTSGSGGIKIWNAKHLRDEDAFCFLLLITLSIPQSIFS